MSAVFPHEGERSGDVLQPVVDGLPALVGFARRAAAADVAIVFEAGSDHLALPLVTDPPILLQPFSLTPMQLDSIDWSNGAVAVEHLRLPSTLVTAAGRPVAQVLFIATPVPDGRCSGVLLLWLSDDDESATVARTSRAGLGAQIGALAPAFSQMLSDRRTIQRRRVTTERFHDLFGSVPIGIVVFEGDGQSGLINESAAKLMGTAAGELPAFDIGGPMRQLRAHARNAGELAGIYAPLQRNVDYAVKTLWDFGTEKYEVDTHPILGNGRNGRIWLFHDVTAQHAVYEHLRQLSVTDPLTGLNNRRHFMEAGELAFAEPPDPAHPLAALMIDIDHFKSINDTHGHQTGDEVLSALSSRLRNVLRDQDLLARLGGEEFAVLLRSLPPDHAVTTAERLRAAIADTPIRTSTTIIEVRVSIGVALQQPADKNLASLLARADLGLYTAKHSGRNQVVVNADI
jgi:diguanylate cyclase (GGDEF)-like protein